MTDEPRAPAVVELAGREWGPVDGRAVVLLHGTGADSTTWSAIAGWPPTWRILALDLRGHGRSPWAGSYELPDLGLDVVDRLDARGWRQVDLVGHSMGAVVAYLLAQRHPSRVRRLVLVEPPPPLPASPPREEGARPSRILDYDWGFQAPFSRQRNHPDPSWWRDLSAITAPTLILAGRDGSFALTDHEAMATRIPDCRLVRLDGGHNLHEDQPAGFLAEVGRFLD